MEVGLNIPFLNYRESIPALGISISDKGAQPLISLATHGILQNTGVHILTKVVTEFKQVRGLVK